MTSSSTLEILKKLEHGEISAAEANDQLTTPPTVERIDAPPFDRTQLPWWIQQVGLWTWFGGTLMVCLGAWIVAATVHTNILWFFIGVPIVLLGALIISIGASTFAGHWLYVNVENTHKRHNNVRFAIPFPLGMMRLALWVIAFVPRAKWHTQDARWQAFWDDPNELFDSIERELRAGRGFSIDVDDKNERVQVYIV
jgi:hypothetical protein